MVVNSIPSKYPFGNVSIIKNSIELISQDIISSSDIEEIQQLEKYKSVLLLKFENMDISQYKIYTNSTSKSSKMFKLPIGITAYKMGENLKNYLEYIKHYCLASGSVPDDCVINALAVNVPIHSELHLFINNNLLDKGFSWEECSNSILSKFKTIGSELTNFFKLLKFNFDTASNYDSQKNLFLNILINTNYNINDKFIVELYLSKQPQSIFDMLNSEYNLANDLNSWDKLMEAINTVQFKIANKYQVQELNNNSSTNVTNDKFSVLDGDSNLKEAVTFYINNFKNKHGGFTKNSGNFNINLPKGINPICINHFTSSCDSDDKCQYDHTDTNFIKAAKYLSSLITKSTKRTKQGKRRPITQDRK